MNAKHVFDMMGCGVAVLKSWQQLLCCDELMMISKQACELCMVLDAVQE